MSKVNKKPDLHGNNNQPYEVYEPYENKASSDSTPTTESGNPTKAADDPAKEESLGQNQVANTISEALRNQLAWDALSGQWFYRAEIGEPFREHDATTAWLTISDHIAKIKPKYTSGFVNGVETFVKAQLAVTKWDNCRNLLPVSNGVLDLTSYTKRNYEQSDRFNWQLPYPYIPSAKCPLIDKTLSRMVGDVDSLIRFLDCWLLMVLLGRYDVQAFLELIGDGGTGKSTFLRLLAFLVGEENTNSTDLHSLEANKFETAALYGKRLTIVTDSARYRGEVPILKSITGGDPVRLERKHHQQRRPFIYEGLVAIAANQPLESSDYSSGLQRRRRPLSINYVVSEAEKRPYRDKQRYPKGFEGALQLEMSGLLNRLLKLDVNDAVNEVSNPDNAMKSQRLAVELETNPLLAWADEYLVVCVENETQIGDNTHRADSGLYSSYQVFTESRGQKPQSLTRFSRALADILRAYGIATYKHRGKYTYMNGLRLRTANDTGTTTLLSGASVEGSDVTSVGSDGNSVGFVDFVESNKPPENNSTNNTSRGSGITNHPTYPAKPTTDDGYSPDGNLYPEGWDDGGGQ